MSAVSPEYTHAAKAIHPAHSITVGDAVLKWYDIAPAAEPVPPELQILARGTLHAAAETSALDLDDELGFVILHRCAESFYFLIVGTWRNENELWQSVWTKSEDDLGFRPWVVDGTHRPTFCVWELGVVWYEQRAWSRHLRSERDHAARATYLHDTFEGEV